MSWSSLQMQVHCSKSLMMEFAQEDKYDYLAS